MLGFVLCGGILWVLRLRKWMSLENKSKTLKARRLRRGRYRMDDQSLKLLREGLLEWRKRLAQEVGTEAPCPLYREPRVRRSDYVRCNRCGINWLDEERHLPNYLNRNPAEARHAARMATVIPKSAATLEEGAENSSSRAWRDRQAEKIRQKLGMPSPGGSFSAEVVVEAGDEVPFAEGT